VARGEEEAFGEQGLERRRRTARFEWGVGEGEAKRRGRKRNGGGHAGRASGRRRAAPRWRPTGRRRGAGGAEGEADARARDARERERG
jgi:hypothetical protein